jgi:hypothetical protein
VVPGSKRDGHQVWGRERLPGFAKSNPVVAEELDAPLHELAISVPRQLAAAYSEAVDECLEGFT